jgi:hypothetical protein
MKLVFDSLAEARAFLDDYEGDGSDDAAETATGTTTRRRRGPGKNKTADGAAATASVQANPGFAPPPVGQAPAAAPAAAGFPGGNGVTAPPSTGFPGVPQVHPLVPQIIAKVSQTMQAGAPIDPIVAWFRTTLPGSEQANWEQITTSFLPKAPEATLVSIAQQIGVLQKAQ